MKTPDDGGCAFPGDVFNKGMTLRQWYAGMALNGLLSSVSSMWDAAEWAEKSFEYADAMIAQERKEQEQLNEKEQS